MNKAREFDECIQNKSIYKTIPNPKRAQQLRKMALIRKEFWQQSTEEKFISLQTEGYYEIMKELVLAKMYEDGFNCTNHVCLFLFAKKQEFITEREFLVLDNLRKIRNNMSYRGFFVVKEYMERNKPFFEKIIKKLTP
jgi:hypothetical protein